MNFNLEQRFISLVSYFVSKSFWASLVLMSLVHLPSLIHKQKIRTSNGITIKLNLNSPAYAAFEDINFDWKSRPAFINTKLKNKLLKAGEPSRILELVPDANESPVRLIALSGLNIKTMPSEVTSMNVASATSETHEQALVKVSQIKMASAITPTMEDERGVLLPLNERKARLADYYANQSFASPTSGLEEKAQELVERELIKQTGSRILAQARSRQGMVASQQSSPKRSQQAQINLFNSYRVEGSIEIVDGLAYTGVNDRIEVFRYFGSEVQQVADVNLNEASFKIDTNELSGYVVGELRANNGELLGLGEIDLVHLAKSKPGLQQLSNVKLRIKPVYDGFNGSILSAYSFGKYKVAVKEQLASIDGLERELKLENETDIKDQTLMYGSSALIRTSGEKHWSSLVVGVSGHKSNIRMYPTTNVEALLKPYRTESSDYGVVWGRVVDESGKPVAGAQVELPGDLGSGAIYFHEFSMEEILIPDEKRTSTSKNGWFAFVKVLPGLQAVRGTLGKTLLPTQVFTAEEEHVSYIELKLGRTRHIDIQLYDAFSKLDIEADLQILGQKEELYENIVGEKILEIPGGQGPVYLHTDAGEKFEVTRFNFNRSDWSLEVPMIRTSWLEAVKIEKKITYTSDTGTVVGFVNSDGFEVFMGEDVKYESSQIIYFDQQGRILKKPHGIKGGGFIMFNVPQGLRTTVVMSDKGEISTKLLVVEPGTTAGFVLN